MVDTVHLKTSACKMFIRILRTGVGKHLRLARFGGPGKLLGYAIREICAGTTTPDGAFHDVVRHTPDQEQPTTYCSILVGK